MSDFKLIDYKMPMSHTDIMNALKYMPYHHAKGVKYREIMDALRGRPLHKCQYLIPLKGKGKTNEEA